MASYNKFREIWNRSGSGMNLNDVRKLLDAKICVGEEYLGRQVETCCGSDLMSDVLAFTKCKTLLCTVLANMQVIRTAHKPNL